MNPVPPPPPMHMPGPPRMMPQGHQRPPPQYQQQGQFQPPHFQQQQPQFHQQGRPDQAINGVARIRDIQPVKQTTEKDVRKQLTTYEAYSIAPTVDEDRKKDKDSNKRNSSSKKSSEGKKETWTKALTIQEFPPQDSIAATIKKLNDKSSVTTRMNDLGPNQRTQISGLVDEKKFADRDIQFEWTVAGLDRKFQSESSGRKTTKSITVYLKRAPKADVDCIELLQRREQQKFQQQLQQQQNAEHHRQVQAMRQQEEINQLRQAQQQQMPPQARPGMGLGPRIGPPMNGGRGRGPPAGVRVVQQSDSGSDSSSSSSSDSDSESETNSDTTPESVSTRPSRSSGRRRGKEYDGRGVYRNRNRSRSRQRNKDYLVVDPPRRRHIASGVHYVPESPRRNRSRTPLGRSTTYTGRPSVVVQDRDQSPRRFFSMDQTPRSPLRPILHHPHRESTPATGMDSELMAKILEVGLKAGRQEKVSSGALTVQRPSTIYRDPLLPRPPMGHTVSDYLDRRTRLAEEQAEELQRQDELRYRDVLRTRETRSPPRGLPRDFDRVPRRFGGADHFDMYSSAPISPSISSRSSDISYSSRGRDPYGPSNREYDHRRRESSLFDSDRDEYDFVGREEANPFRSQRRPSRPPQSRRASFMRSEAIHPHGGRW